VDTSKRKEIELSFDENGTDYPECPYNIDDQIWDNYGADYYSEEAFENEPWSVLRILKNNNQFSKLEHIKGENDEPYVACCLTINFSMLSENNALDLIFQINSLYHDEKVKFLRITVGSNDSEKFEDFFIKDVNMINSIGNWSEHIDALYKYINKQYDEKGVGRFALALTI